MLISKSIVFESHILFAQIRKVKVYSTTAKCKKKEQKIFKKYDILLMKQKYNILFKNVSNGIWVQFIEITMIANIM